MPTFRDLRGRPINEPSEDDDLRNVRPVPVNTGGVPGAIIGSLMKAGSIGKPFKKPRELQDPLEEYGTAAGDSAADQVASVADEITDARVKG